jgi:hypothetical protein
MPRRPRAQVQTRRKRMPPPPVRRTLPPEPVDTAAVEAEDSLQAAPAAAYIRRRPNDGVRPTTTESVRSPARTGRALVTDYGYVLAELEKVGYTFAVLILLLLVVARLLR